MTAARCSAILDLPNGTKPRCYRRVATTSDNGPVFCYQHDPARKDRTASLAALKAAVVEEVMLAWRYGLWTLPTKVDAACAALATAEKEG